LWLISTYSKKKTKAVVILRHACGALGMETFPLFSRKPQISLRTAGMDRQGKKQNDIKWLQIVNNAQKAGWEKQENCWKPLLFQQNCGIILYV